MVQILLGVCLHIFRHEMCYWFLSSWPIFYLNIFRHEMFWYFLLHGRCFMCTFFSRRCFVICFLMADVLLEYFPARDILFVSSWPMFSPHIPGIRCYSICYLVTDLIRYWIYKYFMTYNVLLFPSPPFTNIGLYMFSGIRYLNTLMFCWDMWLFAVYVDFVYFAVWDFKLFLP